MNSWTLDQIARATNGKIVSTVSSQVHGFGTDTRSDLSGQLFVALRGDQFDAHQFLSQAIQKKAAALLVDRAESITAEMQKQVSVILVNDTLKAFQDLAHWHRQQWQGFMIGITGSNGKTSTKEFMASIIQTARNTFYSKGSFNNHWGVPMSLLGLETQHQVALVEMGMNHAGEITELVNIAKPNAVLCTMVGRAHIEHFGSLENIAKAKEEIYVASSREVIRIYNLDNEMTKMMYEKSKKQCPQARKLTFSATVKTADVSLQIQDMDLNQLTISGQIQGLQNTVVVPVFGQQNLTNLMAAATGALAAGLTPQQVWQGLAQCRTVWGRNQLLKTENQAQVIFDGYNANPDSMKALLENVQKISSTGQKIGVFGQMLEMGAMSAELHEELGSLVGKTGFDHVFFYGADAAAFETGFKKSVKGSFAKGTSQLHFQENYSEGFADQLKTSVKPQDLVVIKGSRGMKLERMLLPLKPIGFAAK